VGSAADTGDVNEAWRGAGAPGGERADRVALELPVNAAGARPTKGAEKRDLFSEDTTTALVFPDAAVISLNAAVVPGQLLFLTNKTNNREVVCQVIRKRSYRPTSCYVELQFTEPQADFWGVRFPEKPEALPQTPVEESVESAEATEEEAAVGTAPDAQEVESLREEVGSLRPQLKAWTEAKKAEAAGARKAKEAAASAAKEAEAGPKPLIKMSLPAAAEAMTGSQGSAASYPAPVAEEKVEQESHSAERDAYEDLLPQPDLDFSQTPEHWKRAADDKLYSIYRPEGKGFGKLGKGLIAAIVVVLLAAVVGAAWYKNWLPFARRGTAAASAKKAQVVRPAEGTEADAAAKVATVAAPIVALNVAASQPESVATELKSTVESSAAKENATAAPVAAASVPPKREAKESLLPGKKPASASKAAVATAPKKRGAVTTAPVAAEPEAVAPDAPLVEAKLLRAAEPMYPVEALQNFITGDVKVSAEVDASGRVDKVNVISGPAALREAAVEAMKKYQYEPATRGGKPVASQVRVTVKFWFDP
jgi:periplasmic protein TonB